MKKLSLIFVLLFSLSFFNSCTPEALNEESTEIQVVDPDDDGTIDDGNTDEEY
jgi:hypothetical protein